MKPVGSRSETCSQWTDTFLPCIVSAAISKPTNKFVKFLLQFLTLTIANEFNNFYQFISLRRNLTGPKLIQG